LEKRTGFLDTSDFQRDFKSWGEHINFCIMKGAILLAETENNSRASSKKSIPQT
jgi:hypothetical protein